MKFLLPVFLLLSLAIRSQTVIMGTAPGAEGKTITLTAPGDLLTFYEVALASAEVGQDGSFSLSVELTETRYITLSIRLHSVSIFAEPGKTYELRIVEMNYDEDREVNPFIQSRSLQAVIMHPEADDLNIMIGDFNALYDGFVVKNFNALYKERDRRKLDTLRHNVMMKFGDVQNLYFRNYVDYKFAALEQLTQSLSQSQLARKYFTGKPVLYMNLEYMDFFNAFYARYLTATSKPLKFTDYQQVLKGTDPGPALLKILSKDSLLPDPQLRELVLLKGLLEFSNTQGYERDAIVQVVRSLNNTSAFIENREVAGNVLQYLLRLKPGTDAPPFELPDRDRKMVSLDDLRGKPVLVSFWSTYCEGCLAELDMMVPLYHRYGEGIHFVSIATDRDFMKMRLFLDLKPDYRWTFLHLDDQIGLLKDYDVRIYPLFVLIDSEGRILKYPAGYPGKDLAETLGTLLQP